MLMVDPSLLDKYYEVAQRIAQKAIVRGDPPFATYRNRFYLKDTAKRGSIRYQCEEPGFNCRENDPSSSWPAPRDRLTICSIPGPSGSEFQSAACMRFAFGRRPIPDRAENP